MLKKINIYKREGNEAFLNNRNCATKDTLLDFWMWAHSDLIGNAERGILAEYIVGMALNANCETRTEWDSYDILTADGIKIEVKSSGYIQTWGQKEYSKISFGIQPTFAWDSVSNTYEKIKKRQADIYVFCIYKHKDQETINPLDLNQWEFFVSPAKVLNEKIPNQKNITLSRLKEFGAVYCEYDDLKDTIYKGMGFKDNTFPG